MTNRDKTSKFSSMTKISKLPKKKRKVEEELKKSKWPKRQNSRNSH